MEWRGVSQRRISTPPRTSAGLVTYLLPTGAWRLNVEGRIPYAERVRGAPPIALPVAQGKLVETMPARNMANSTRTIIAVNTTWDMPLLI